MIYDIEHAVDVLGRTPGVMRELLQGLPDGHGEILAMRLEGHTKTDIAAKLGVSRQTVHRALSLLRQRLGRVLPQLPYVVVPRRSASNGSGAAQG